MKRIDSEGRDVTDLPGLWDEGDTFIDGVIAAAEQHPDEHDPYLG